jgi:hypothetical protein
MTWHPSAAPALSSWTARVASRCPVAEPWPRVAENRRSRLQARPLSLSGRISARSQLSASGRLPAFRSNSHAVRWGRSFRYRGFGFKKLRGRTSRNSNCVLKVKNGWCSDIECPRSRIEASRDSSYFTLFSRSAQRTQLALCEVYSSGVPQGLHRVGKGANGPAQSAAPLAPLPSLRLL